MGNNSAFLPIHVPISPRNFASEKLTLVTVLKTSMEKEFCSQDKIRSQAGCVLQKTDMLIRLCDRILPEEEGRARVHLRFEEQRKVKKKEMILNVKNKIVGKK